MIHKVQVRSIDTDDEVLASFHSARLVKALLDGMEGNEYPAGMVIEFPHHRVTVGDGE